MRRSLHKLASSPRHFRSSCQSFKARVFSAKAQTPKLQPADQVIFSGIQPTGVPHLGNYLGALRQWRDLQDSVSLADGQEQPSKNQSQLFFSVVDLHALTGNQHSAEMFSNLRKDTFASLLAIGLDPSRSNVFFQSHVTPSHTELMWILSTIAGFGYLSRMTQWKSKLDLPPDADMSNEKTTEKLKLGLFSYPVLQAADILIHGATLVPVGEDQAQHIEFTRNLARSFNAHYGGGKMILREPEVLISPAKRIMSLRDPGKKMSKSHVDVKSRILITDPPDIIKQRVKEAVTDSEDGIGYDPVKRPGWSNLVEILKHVSRSKIPCEELAKEHGGMSKGAFKALVADAIIKELEGFRERFEELKQPGNPKYRDAVDQGWETASGNARLQMVKVRHAIGL